MSLHTFHIPVLGLGYSIDTPLKVARFGINSVVSIVDDELCERMREYHCDLQGLPYKPIRKPEPDSRARRITAYLDLLNNLVTEQLERLKQESFREGSELCKYFDLLPDCVVRKRYLEMRKTLDPNLKRLRENELLSYVVPGRIDANIMAKVDKANYDHAGHYLGDEHTDALAALRGFARSTLNAALVISAGINKRLYSYLENFADFFPDKDGQLRKTIILKVSDYRSATIQAKLLAKKGIWVSEFRVESGLNCGGHAFATDGLLMGPILQEFKERRDALKHELFLSYRDALAGKGIHTAHPPEQRLTAQGGIGTAEEQRFLLDYYGLDATGWGSPFLLVPEATNVDVHTRKSLADAGEKDFYLSNSSPLGVPFNTFAPASMETLRQTRIDRGHPGSPCTKKYLCSNTEFTDEPICTASRKYQRLKTEQLRSAECSLEEQTSAIEDVMEKVCLCEGLCASVYLENGQLGKKEAPAVSICPGPNTAYFNGIYSLKEMVDHIYGRLDLLDQVNRPHMFINELELYKAYYLRNHSLQASEKQARQAADFRSQLQVGISYYQTLSENGELKIDIQYETDSLADLMK